MEDAIEFINGKLFTEEKPVLFTDLIHKFRLGPSKAKETMYTYYRSNKTLKYNCIIICCYRDRIKVVSDINNVESQESIIDCFIYAFNPMEEFAPVNRAIDQSDYLLIQNPHEFVIPQARSKTVEEEPITREVPRHSSRSKTVPQTTKDEKSSSALPKKQQPAKSKDTGLRSTTLLAKMRADRENKEAQRQKELTERREKELQDQNSKNDAQTNELKQLFANDSDSDNEDSQKEESEKPGSTVEPDELDEILDTTAEESLLKQSQSQEEEPKVKQEPQDTSYVDEDGYIVTNRSANNSSTSTPSNSRKRPGNSSQNSQQKSKKPIQRRKTQGTLENFFKRSK